MKTTDMDIFMSQIETERLRQKTLPGSEWDAKNSVNDWIAIASHYLSEPAKRASSQTFSRGMAITQQEYEDSLIKAAAVILAALEYSDVLKNRGDLK